MTRYYCMKTNQALKSCNLIIYPITIYLLTRLIAIRTLKDRMKDKKTVRQKREENKGAHQRHNN